VCDLETSRIGAPYIYIYIYIYDISNLRVNTDYLWGTSTKSIVENFSVIWTRFAERHVDNLWLSQSTVSLFRHYAKLA